MLVDALDHHQLYTNLHPRFTRAFRFLCDTNVSQLAPGKQEIDGERIFAIVANQMGKPPTTALLEFHRRYIDIQYVIAGPDVMGWLPLELCRRIAEPYDAERDLGFFFDRPSTWCEVPPGYFAIFFPHDAHAPLAIEQPVHKVVVKIAVKP
jgi:YhcH/YjgK/YiaL family protein